MPRIISCKNLFCIYWDEDFCILDHIDLDIQGDCENCIYVEIEPTMLEVYRNKLLYEFDEKKKVRYNYYYI